MVADDYYVELHKVSYKEIYIKYSVIGCYLWSIG